MQTKDNFSATQHKLQYNDGFAMLDNAAQQWWYSTIFAAHAISNIGKFARMVYSDFFGKDSGGSPHYSDKKK